MMVITVQKMNGNWGYDKQVSREADSMYSGYEW